MHTHTQKVTLGVDDGEATSPSGRTGSPLKDWFSGTVLSLPHLLPINTYALSIGRGFSLVLFFFPPSLPPFPRTRVSLSELKPSYTSSLRPHTIGAQRLSAE